MGLVQRICGGKPYLKYLRKSEISPEVSPKISLDNIYGCYPPVSIKKQANKTENLKSKEKNYDTDIPAKTKI